jgi:hypothetical protein
LRIVIDSSASTELHASSTGSSWEPPWLKDAKVVTADPHFKDLPETIWI